MFPAIHLGLTSTFCFPTFNLEPGVTIDGTVYKQGIRSVDIDGQPYGLSTAYDVGSYIGIPVLIYPDKLPFGLHFGIKPKFEANSVSIVKDDVNNANDDGNYYPIHYGRIYAEAGIPEYWAIDLQNDLIEVKNHPEQGIYKQTRLLIRGDDYTNKDLDLPFTANDLLGG